MLRFFRELVAVPSLNIFPAKRPAEVPGNPAADVVNKKLKEGCIDHLAGSIWFAKINKSMWNKMGTVDCRLAQGQPQSQMSHLQIKASCQESGPDRHSPVKLKLCPYQMTLLNYLPEYNMSTLEELKNADFNLYIKITLFIQGNFQQKVITHRSSVAQPRLLPGPEQLQLL